MEESTWMIVRKEKTSTKIKNYFKNVFTKIFGNKKKKRKPIVVQTESKTNDKKEITIEYYY